MRQRLLKGLGAGLVAVACAMPVARAAPAAPAAEKPAADAPAAAATVDAATVDAAATRQLHELFDARWEALMQTYPEWATFAGDHRYGDRLRDASPAAIAAEFSASRRALARARAIPRQGLSSRDRASLDVFVHGLEDQLRTEPFVGYRSMSLGALGGFQTGFAGLLRASPATTRVQVEQVLARMAAYPRRVDQELALLREGLALRWVPPREVLERVLAQIDRQLAPEVDKSPFFDPFTRLGKDIPAAEQQALQARGRQAIAEQVLPALRRLRAFVASEYLPAAPASGALGTYPSGAEVYAHEVRSNTTTELGAAQIHAIGLRELARLRGEMEGVMKEVKFEGDFSAFVKYLNTDPKFFHTGPEALLAGYRDIAKRIDPELPKLFAELPRATYGVRAMPAHQGSDAAEYYDGPALDGSQPGWFNANALAWKQRPIWGMETLVAHEAVPGHHLQVARAVELGELPKFRRGGGYTVYSEGWALYAETLGFELGLYQDPHSRFGHLQWQAFRAARLVVDTGLHALGWSRQRAIDFMVERTGEKPDFVASEVDRYVSWPGQALAYMIGQLKIVELRDRAKARLGERFDTRKFHMVVLDQGSVPLPVLERAVDDWLAAAASGLDAAVQAARADAARRTGVAAESLVLVSADSVTWSDGSLGCPRPGVMYTQALVPGYRVRLRGPDDEMDYHASTRGALVLCPPGRAVDPQPGASRL